MGALQVAGPDTPFVNSAEEMAGQFSAELMALVPAWKERLERQPTCFPELEAEVHKAFSRGADLLVVAGEQPLSQCGGLAGENVRGGCRESGGRDYVGWKGRAA